MLNLAVRRALICAAATAWLLGAAAPFAVADTQAEARRVHIEFETGTIWQGRNEIQIPDTAAETRFSLADIQGSTPIVQRRVEATWNPGRRHVLRFVYQPLGFSGTGSFTTPVLFAGGTFTPGTPVESNYKLDSYIVDVDGLVAVQGRAIDAAAKIRHDLTDHWSLAAGYRTFEGGVDNSERFAFGWFHFAVGSIGYRY